MWDAGWATGETITRGGGVLKTISDRDNFRKAVELKHRTEVDPGMCLCQHTCSSSRLSFDINVLKVHVCPGRVGLSRCIYVI
jgi:hypothetical protein